MKELADRIASYEGTGSQNEQIHAEFAALTDTIPYLKDHRDTIEARRWGHGHRAFHFLWYLIMKDLAGSAKRLRFLEIGVFKGQVLSLWGIIAKQERVEFEATGVSPFQGNEPRGVGSVLSHVVKLRLSPSYRRRWKTLADAGSIYAREDYHGIVEDVLRHFGLDRARFHLIRGSSHDAAVKAQVVGEPFDVVYIDGDHSYDGALQDVEDYAPLVRPGGFLVMDDASFFLPGDSFFKGYESVSRAADRLPYLGFKNVFNVGHNRLYVRQKSGNGAASARL